MGGMATLAGYFVLFFRIHAGKAPAAVRVGIIAIGCHEYIPPVWVAVVAPSRPLPAWMGAPVREPPMVPGPAKDGRVLCMPHGPLWRHVAGDCETMTSCKKD